MRNATPKTEKVNNVDQEWAILVLEGCSAARFPATPAMLDSDYLDPVCSTFWSSG